MQYYAFKLVQIILVNSSPRIAIIGLAITENTTNTNKYEQNLSTQQPMTKLTNSELNSSLQKQGYKNCIIPYWKSNLTRVKNYSFVLFNIVSINKWKQRQTVTE